MVEASHITALAVILSALGSSFVLKDYISNLVAYAVLRRGSRNDKLNSGVRIKILTSPIIKGDIIHIGPLRTTLMEVGDGERLPSVQTGRTVKVPNFMLVNTPLVIYGDTIVDEVIAYLQPPFSNLDELVNKMKEAIVSCGHEVVEVGLYQKEDRLIVHGIFKVKTSEIADERAKILKTFLVNFSR